MGIIDSIIIYRFFIARILNFGIVLQNYAMILAQKIQLYLDGLVSQDFGLVQLLNVGINKSLNAMINLLLIVLYAIMKTFVQDALRENI